MGNKEKQNIYYLEEFLDTPRVDFLSLYETTSEIYASVFKQLKEKGKPIPTNDIWIAATTIQYGLALFTLDKHFKNIDGLLLY
ncbi:MAG: PIN domain-containing protein [Verrucomicrobiota bacterium]|nr:PIN domain-containing protein [Verrucomicrobiota bacterium]